MCGQVMPYTLNSSRCSNYTSLWLARGNGVVSLGKREQERREGGVVKKASREEKREGGREGGRKEGREEGRKEGRLMEESIR